MEPVTHFLTGACMGRAGFNRKTAYATLAMTLAAEASDIDMLWGLHGPVAVLEHHRGITHTFLGAPLVALAVTGVVWTWHKARGHKRQRDNGPPVRWGLLWAFATIACLVHILLDWTNNYGVRPFFPFDPRWYAGSFVFLFEPVIFAVLLVGLVAPAIFGMADREIGVRRPRFRGQGWAIFALSAVVLVWCWRWAEHRIALDLLAEHPLRDDVALRACANPFPITPYRWYVVVEYPDRYQTAIVDTRTGEVRTNPSEDTYYKSPQTPAVLAADRSWLGRVYLDWSQFPWITEDSLSDPTSGSATVVRFRDLRFAYPVLSGQKRHHAPLGGSVTVGPQGQIEEMEMGGHVQH